MSIKLIKLIPVCKTFWLVFVYLYTEHNIYVNTSSLFTLAYTRTEHNYTELNIGTYGKYII